MPSNADLTAARALADELRNRADAAYSADGQDFFNHAADTITALAAEVDRLERYAEDVEPRLAQADEYERRAEVAEAERDALRAVIEKAKAYQGGWAGFFAILSAVPTGEGKLASALEVTDERVEAVYSRLRAQRVDVMYHEVETALSTPTDHENRSRKDA